MDMIKLRQQLIEHEGIRYKPYVCPAGKLTVGVGRNLEAKGISHEEAMMMLDNDLRESAQDVVVVLGNGAWDGLSDARQRCLVDMRFNLGPRGFRGFKRMLQAARTGHYQDAAREMLDSKWAGQVGARAKHLAGMMRDG